MSIFRHLVAAHDALAYATLAAVVFLLKAAGVVVLLAVGAVLALIALAWIAVLVAAAVGQCIGGIIVEEWTRRTGRWRDTTRDGQDGRRTRGRS